jgi:glutathione S-transferase
MVGYHKPSAEIPVLTRYHEVATINPESGLMPSDLGQAAEVRNWLFICEAEVRSAFHHFGVSDKDRLSRL